MHHILAILGLFFFIIFQLPAQANECYHEFLLKGKKADENYQYDKAIKQFEAAKICLPENKSNEDLRKSIDSLVEKTSKKYINALKAAIFIADSLALKVYTENKLNLATLQLETKKYDLARNNIFKLIDSLSNHKEEYIGELDLAKEIVEECDSLIQKEKEFLNLIKEGDTLLERGGRNFIFAANLFLEAYQMNYDTLFAKQKQYELFEEAKKCLVYKCSGFEGDKGMIWTLMELAYLYSEGQL